MTCSSADNSLNPPSLGPPPDIGFGPIFSPIQIPFPDITLPAGIPEDILQILRTIFAKIPGGTLVPNADDTFRNVFDAVASLLNQLGPYLAIYNFFQALLEIIMCIIDVICALMNPFSLIGAIIRLFKRCIPNFISIFPFIALLVMILSFILLLIALIEFLINYIISLINDLIENLNKLSEAFSVGNEEGILAITQKIASLLCLIEQAFALLIAFQALFVIIQALASFGGRGPCSPGESECCTDEFCPPFIANSPNGISGMFGRMVYHREVEQDSVGFGLPASLQLPNLRAERWQFINDGSAPYQFIDIITAINGNIFWPEPNVFSKGDNLQTVVPYTLNIRMFLDPSVYDNNIADPTPRYFNIRDVIVTSKPYVGVTTYNNSTDFSNQTGTLQLIGGSVYEDNGNPVLSSMGDILTLDTLITSAPYVGMGLPSTEDGYSISNIEYTLNPNHKVLFKYQLITAGCVPEVAQESTVLNTTLPTLPTDVGGNIIPSVIQQIGELPDLTAALDCLNQAMANFRNDVSLENAAVFQASVTGCLTDLKTQAEGVFGKVFDVAYSQYNSIVTLSPSIQFVSDSIRVYVDIRDHGGNVIGTNIPQSLREDIQNKLSANVTFGTISKFTYDGSQFFVADITSDEVGNGEVSVAFDGKFISSIENRDNDDPTTIQITTLPYQFVGGIINSSGKYGDSIGGIRRDNSDTSES